MKKPFRRWLAALMAASMTLALTACSGGDNSSTASASGDKMFNVVMTSNYSGFDPLRTNDSVSSNVNNQIYETLYRLEDDGFISSSWQTGGAARTAPKKIYTATAAGRRALLAMQEEWRALCRCVQACGNVLAPEGDGGNVQT